MSKAILSLENSWSPSSIIMTVNQFALMVVFRIATMDLASYGVGFKRDGDGFGVMGTVIEVERDRGEGTVELAGKV
ncbi:hypothetical protein Tco_0104937 [Tanacetum coccineum]